MWKMARWRTLATWFVPLACVAFVALILDPRYLFNSNTVGGGDSGGTLFAAHYVATNLLPQGKITGWSTWWFLGYPAYVFYFPLPAVGTALVGYVVGFNVASHWCVMGSVMALPLALYLFGRLVRLRSPIPEFLAIAAVGYLFEPTWQVSGGNLVSLAVGEYSYSWALAFGVVTLGVVWRMLQTGRHRVLAAMLLATTILCHIVVGIGVGLTCAVMVLSVAMNKHVNWRERKAALGVGVGVGLVGLGLSLWWLGSFVGYASYSNTVGWPKNTSYQMLLMPGQPWLLVLSLVGVVAGLRQKWRVVPAVAGGALAMALLFIYSPATSSIWNERFYPLYVLFVWILGSVGAGFLVVWSRAWFRRQGQMALSRIVSWMGASLAVLLVVCCWSMSGWAPFGAIPEGHFLITKPAWNHETTAGMYRLPELTALSGLQASGNYGVLQRIDSLLIGAAKKWGCGAVESEGLPPNAFNTAYPWAPLSEESDGCVSVPDGPFFESSPTRAEFTELDYLISYVESGAYQEGVKITTNENLTKGVALMQQLGIKYYVAYTKPTLAQAAKQPDLRLIADGGGIWHVYLVLHSTRIQAAQYQPIVLTGPGVKGEQWSLTAERFFEIPSIAPLTFTQSGPAAWKRAYAPAVGAGGTKATTVLPKLVKEPATKISHYTTTDDTISFDVSRLGVPIDIKTSWFPNWQVRGASGVYRSLPNFMVVVPTAHHVVLTYGTTRLDHVSNDATAAAVAGLAFLGLSQRGGTWPWPADADVVVTLPDDAVADKRRERRARWRRRLFSLERKS